VYYDITQEQHEQLLKPLNERRVAKRSGGGGKQLSYLEAWDVKAHLNRIFGFGGWSWNVTTAELAFEDQPTEKNRNYVVGYKVIGVLKVIGAEYAEAAVGSANLPSRGDAHDMAIKTAESDALKRAAINLGDQFGLSLYNNGSLKPVVGSTLYSPQTRVNLDQSVRALLVSGDGDLPVVDVEPVVEHHDEPVEAPVDEPVDDIPADEADTPAPAVEEYVTRLRAAAVEGDLAAIITMKAEITKAGLGDAVHDGKTLAKIADLAVVHAGKTNAKAGLSATEVQS
jgi:hypothetical protein